MSTRTYAESGVDVERGDRFTSYIASLSSKAVSRDLGGFAGGIELPLQNYKRPILLSSTDGVGTKLLVAKRLGTYDTVGIDLVAMCVNDLSVAGADPLVFLDYIACGQINEPVLEQVIRGVVAGCEEAGCTLAGGETAEMPDMYGKDEFDLAGFATGIVEAEERLPRQHEMKAGDLVVGLQSSGIHSNGFGLARKVVADANEETWRELLTPTRIYCRQLGAVRSVVLGAAHVTGGGLQANLDRVLPPTLRASLTWQWPTHEIFSRIQSMGDIELAEMRRVFNMGIGIALVIRPDQLNETERRCGEPLLLLGKLTHG